MTNNKGLMTKYKLPFLQHPDPKLQFAWNCAELGLLVFPFTPLIGGVVLGLAMLVTWLQKCRKIIYHPLNIGFALFIVLLIISTIFAFDKKEAILGLFNFLPFILFFAGFSTLIQTPEQLRRLSWILVVNSVPIVVIGLGQLFYSWHTTQQWEGFLGWAIAPGGNPPGRMAAIFMYANILAAYLVIVFILGLGLWLDTYQVFIRCNRNREQGIGNTENSLDASAASRRVRRFPPLALAPRKARLRSSEEQGRISATLSLLFLTVVVIANFVALILTNSRNGWAIACFACLAYALYQGWHIAVAGVTGFVTSIFLAAFAPLSIGAWFRKIVPAYFWARLNDQLYPDRPIGLLRKTQWQFAWSMSQKRPWTGWGLRNFTQLYETQTQIWLGHPHNLFLMLCAEIGLPATLLFCVLLGWIFIGGAKLLQNSQYFEKEDKLIFFSYLLVYGAWILFNTADVTLFDFRLNTISWLLLSSIPGIINHYKYSL
ncbi:O-antigen ligase family protein [Chlorogloeopsis sp. ULAP01]|uniref:O-antigen ligase family protein n=1 Tax=Chlorogloeopsis sp. ULAP01 TaxID=3056483 RepID=UPI0025AA8CDD|nr:O-antigen ligase family protein [Chlorogloeopsis sp. ULAP01]MDM9380331.1 O-antigen ligase family protein [Chlorogloeopsis sp. ULAP01]